MLASVSVIIPAYNAETTIERAIVSALTQTRPVLETLVIDDGSTDGTAAVASRFAHSVTVIRKANGGPASARNLGARHARGEWLAMLDADDFWFPAKLERQLAHADADAVQLIHCLSDHRQWSIPLELTFDDLWERNWIANSSVLIRRAAFEELAGFDEARALISVEDYNLWLRLAAAGMRIATLPETLVHYERGGGLSSQTESFLAASLRNIDDIAERFHVAPARKQRKRLDTLETVAESALYRREMKLARRLYGELVRAAPGEPAYRRKRVAALLPAAVLDLRRWLRAVALGRAEVAPTPVRPLELQPAE